MWIAGQARNDRTALLGLYVSGVAALHLIRRMRMVEHESKAVPMIHPPLPRLVTLVALALAVTLSSGCAVVTVAGAAVGVAATGVGLAVDGAVGAVKLTGKAIGAAAGAVMPGGD